MPRRRVAVTGMGVFCALGNNVQQTWRSACAGLPGISPFVSDKQLRFPNGARIANYDPAQHFSPQRLVLLDPFAQFALIAAREAIADSGIQFTDELRAETAVVTGTGMGGQSTLDAGFARLHGHKASVDPPMIVPRSMANAGASQISMEFALTGPAFTFSTACCSATHAIGHAFRMVRDGDVELAITGGSEAPFGFGLLKAFEAMRVISQDTCRPFSCGRSGFILGEGGAMLVLERLDAALARGATIHGEIIGFGMSSDAGHITRLSTSGPARAMRAALRDSGLDAGQIDYINAHGSATVLGDQHECQAIYEVFGPRAATLPVSSTKSMHGHALGATGALEAVCTIAALRDGILPPTANFTAADPECPLDAIPNQARAAQASYALSNSFAFGGLNAVLAFRAPGA